MVVSTIESAIVLFLLVLLGYNAL